MFFLPIRNRNHHPINIKTVVYKFFQFGQGKLLSFGKTLKFLISLANKTSHSCRKNYDLFSSNPSRPLNVTYEPLLDRVDQRQTAHNVQIHLIDLCKEFVCLGFYAVSTVFQLFNCDSSQIHVSWTIFNQYLTGPLS